MLLIIAIIVYGIMVALFWAFIRGADILNGEDEE